MKKIIIGSAVAAVLGVVSGNANAALATNAILNFDDTAPTRHCNAYPDPSTPTGCAYNSFTDLTGVSYFAMDTNGDGQWTDGTQSAGFETHKDANGNWLPEFTTLPNERTGMNGGTTGITLGSGGQGAGTATYDMTDPAAPVLTSFTTGDMDAGWGFFGAAGWHTTNDADGVTVASDDLSGNATLDMSGWTVFWNGGDIDMGTGMAATVTCGNTCEAGDSFTLDYDAVVPSGGFAGVAYALHLEGTIGAASAVPVPAAVWLFGSGLVGLAGVARRRKAA